MTALCDHLASRSSVLETQVEGWRNIDDLSPAPTHRQQPACPPSPTPQPPTLVPKVAARHKTTPDPKRKQPATQNANAFESPPKKKKRLEGVLLGALLAVLNGLLLLLLLLLPYLQLFRLVSRLPRVRQEDPLARQTEDPPPPEPPRRPLSPAQRQPPRTRLSHPQRRTCQGIRPRPSSSQSPRQGGRAVKVQGEENVYSISCDKGVWGTDTARRPLPRVDPPQKKGRPRGWARGT